MTPECPRLWEAEALEDGRLKGADRASLDRHLETCAECRAELAGLESLRTSMEELHYAESTPMERQRRRAALLRRANQELVLSSGARNRRSGIAAVVLVLGAVSLVALKNLHRETPTIVPTEIAPPPKFDVETLQGAVWRSHAEGTTNVVELVDGCATFTVPHLQPSQRLIVSLPDAEIEVRGTNFTVRVAFDKTESVSVAAGSVAFRKRGEAEIMLLPGDRWPKVMTGVTPVDVVAEQADAMVANAPPIGSQVARSPVAASAPSSLRFSTVRGERFEDAMRSFRAAEYERADAELALFAREFPNDPSCEDAAFLRAVARWRLNDREGAAALAQSYLNAYPRGLRRLEAQHMIEGTAR